MEEVKWGIGTHGVGLWESSEDDLYVCNEKGCLRKRKSAAPDAS